jgi:hypothetical protein
MVVIIKKITGIGGNPPTHYSVDVELLSADGCTVVQVRTSCSEKSQRIDTPHVGVWSVDLPNDKPCMCGETVEVWAWCGTGEQDPKLQPTILPFICDDCPHSTITVDLGLCINGKRTVTFHASITNVPATGAVLQWDLPDSIQPSTTAFAVMSDGPLPDQIVEYLTNTSGSVTRTASLKTIFPLKCPPSPCSVTIDPCPPCCPSITLSPPTVTGCAPGSAVATFIANEPTWSKECMPVQPTSYSWTLFGPDGRTYQRNTKEPKTDTNQPWTDAVGTPANVQFVNGGICSISVFAVYDPALAMSCNPTATGPFTIPACPCPTGQHRDSTSGECVDNTCPAGQHWDSASGKCVDDNCPAGQHWDSESAKCIPDTATPPDGTPSAPTPSGGGGGFDLCCFLIWWWGISHLVAGSLLYFGNWIAGVISSAVATIVLGIWMAVCCWPCALTFWRCCTLLKWVIMFNDFLVITLFGFFAAGGLHGVWVVLAFGLVSTIVRIAMGASKCGAIPNIFDPTTWPPCRCP